MHETVETPIGYVIVEASDNSAKVSFKQTAFGDLEADYDGDGRTVTFVVSKSPRLNSEVTQNGSTFEVIGVRKSDGGYDVLNGNTGCWEKWVED